MSVVFVAITGITGRSDLARLRHRVDASTKRNGLPQIVWTVPENGTTVGIGGISERLAVVPECHLVGTRLIAGTCRLDNRHELLKLADRTQDSTSDSDLRIVAHAIDTGGIGGVARILGDFAFIIWNYETRELIAVRDAFGVQPLVFTEVDDSVVVASRILALQDDEDYDLQFFAHFLVSGYSRSNRTAFRRITQVEPGTMVIWQGGTRSIQRFWSAENFDVDHGLVSQTEVAVAQFRHLMREAVKNSISNVGSAWAQLSGGLDSSSVVCVAHELLRNGDLEKGLGGTITFVDTLGTGDERRFSDAVTEKIRLRNDPIVDYWAWQDDGISPPLTDHPDERYPFFARDRHLNRVLHDHGVSVLLSGVGPDHFLAGNLYFFADRILSAQALPTLIEMGRWATLGRLSYWRFAFENGVMPNLPHLLRTIAATRSKHLPPWFPTPFLREFRPQYHLAHVVGFTSPVGRKFQGNRVSQLAHMSSCLCHGRSYTEFQMRFPFLYRPLVEFGLQLPPQLVRRPFSSKWILREAVRDLLPASVVNRRGKGSIQARVIWSLGKERTRVDELLKNPHLADLGCIDREKLRSACTGTRTSLVPNTNVMATLSLETWLQVRSGRWAARG